MCFSEWNENVSAQILIWQLDSIRSPIDLITWGHKSFSDHEDVFHEWSISNMHTVNDNVSNLMFHNTSTMKYNFNHAHSVN